MAAATRVNGPDDFGVEQMLPVVSEARIRQEAGGSVSRLLEVALATEYGIAELAAGWVPSTRERDVKVAFLQQAGDHAEHTRLVSRHLPALGIDLNGFNRPPMGPLFDCLRGIESTVERIAGGLVAFESIAYAVNETLAALCEESGDAETGLLYRERIQPDECRHQQLGQRLLARYASDAALQQRAAAVVARVCEAAKEAMKSPISGVAVRRRDAQLLATRK